MYSDAELAAREVGQPKPSQRENVSEDEGTAPSADEDREWVETEPPVTTASPRKEALLSRFNTLEARVWRLRWMVGQITSVSRTLHSRGLRCMTRRERPRYRRLCRLLKRKSLPHAVLRTERERHRGLLRVKAPAPIEHELELLKSHLTNANSLPMKHNLNYTERMALKNITRNKELTIKKADKGGKIVIMDTETYIEEGLTHLQDTRTYIEEDRNYTKDTTIAVNRLLKEMKDTKHITKHLYLKLRKNPDTTKTQHIYFLRKIHKSPHEIRPIVSACNGPTENISAWIDYTLKQLLDTIPSLVTDTIDLVNRVEDLKVPKDALLVSIDVKSLYPSIPQNECIRRAIHRYNKHTPPLERIPETFLKRAITHILNDNTFTFNDRHFRQIKGLAMGTKAVPTLANIFMAEIEENFLSHRSSTNQCRVLARKKMKGGGEG